MATLGLNTFHREYFNKLQILWLVSCSSRDQWATLCISETLHVALRQSESYNWPTYQGILLQDENHNTNVTLLRVLGARSRNVQEGITQLVASQYWDPGNASQRCQSCCPNRLKGGLIKTVLNPRGVQPGQKQTSNTRKSAADGENTWTYSDRLFAQLINRLMHVVEVITVLFCIYLTRSVNFVVVNTSFRDMKINWPSLSSFKTKVWPLSCLIKNQTVCFPGGRITTCWHVTTGQRCHG